LNYYIATQSMLIIVITVNYIQIKKNIIHKDIKCVYKSTWVKRNYENS